MSFSACFKQGYKHDTETQLFLRLVCTKGKWVELGEKGKIKQCKAKVKLAQGCEQIFYGQQNQTLLVNQAGLELHWQQRIR